MSMESLYEYGSRAGLWRLLRLFRERRVPVTIFGTAMALERHPDAVEAMLEDGHELASHGWRWVSYQQIDEATEREHVARAAESLRRLTGKAPEGWYTGRDSPNTRRLVVEHGGFVYDSDVYNDDLPYWTRVLGKPHLIVPYGLVVNDARYVVGQGFGSPEHFFETAKAHLDRLRDDGDDVPRMMSVGMHPRISGNPARSDGLARFIEYGQSLGDVWFARRIDIATTFIEQEPADKWLDSSR